MNWLKRIILIFIQTKAIDHTCAQNQFEHKLKKGARFVNRMVLFMKLTMWTLSTNWNAEQTKTKLLPQHMQKSQISLSLSLIQYGFNIKDYELFIIIIILSYFIWFAEQITKFHYRTQNKSMRTFHDVDTVRITRQIDSCHFVVIVIAFFFLLSLHLCSAYRRTLSDKKHFKYFANNKIDERCQTFNF